MRRPELSVVIPSVNGLGDLVGCLEAVCTQQGVGSLEVLVADRCGDPVRAELRRRFPDVRVIAAPPGTPIPKLRAMAFEAATGDSVAVIEDHVIVPAGWARQLLAAQRDGAAVIGGSVENAATERLVDRAAFLCEYSHCLPPLPAGAADWLPGNNIVYSRRLLERYRSAIEAGRWEDHLHDVLRADGVELVRRPEIHVEHRKHYTVREYLSQRYLYARSYAGARLQGASVATRVAYGAAAAVLLPPLLLYRIVRRVARRRRYRAELVKSLPLLLLFVTAWAAGEAVGYCAGPGDSLARVR
jgi:glycosyltransferase involved in cell wall biosynthesis